MTLLSERETQNMLDEQAESKEKFCAGLMQDLLIYAHACYTLDHGIISKRDQQLNFRDICESAGVEDIQEQLNVYALFRNHHFKPHMLSLPDQMKISGINTHVELAIDKVCKEKFR